MIYNILVITFRHSEAIATTHGVKSQRGKDPAQETLHLILYKPELTPACTPPGLQHGKR